MELQIGYLIHKSNITKSCGIPAYEVFQFLLLLAFQGKNLFRFLNSKHKDQAVSKNTYYRFLNETSYNWSKFLLLLAAKVTAAFGSLTRPETHICAHPRRALCLVHLYKTLNHRSTLIVL